MEHYNDVLEVIEEELAEDARRAAGLKECVYTADGYAWNPNTGEACDESI